jgi:MoaA/NifB/PqqE/SkfB family radical SAM enzyme
MLLDGDRLGRLIDHGVTSLAVSLDGARPETNDAIRAGSRLVTVVDHLREAVRRRESGADLRIGISTVACEANVTELPALGALALDLGLDWLKIEELVPATPWARHNALEPRDGRLADAMARLRELTVDGSLVLVDHLDPPAGCHCQGESDPRLRAFREADDFANRVRFHPCRADWEQACVDPDGLVHPADYLAPAVGSLGDQSMLAIWDGAAMRQRRQGALARLSEALRRRCPAES